VSQSHYWKVPSLVIDFLTRRAWARKTGHIGNSGQDSSLGQKIATTLLEMQEFRHSRDHRSQANFELAVCGEADQSFLMPSLMPRVARENRKTQGRAAADQRPKRSRAVSSQNQVPAARNHPAIA